MVYFVRNSDYGPVAFGRYRFLSIYNNAADMSRHIKICYYFCKMLALSAMMCYIGHREKP